MKRDTVRVSWRELLLHALLLLAMLVCLFPATFLRGERTAPGALLFEQSPWKYYRPADLQPVKNKNTSEYLAFFAKLYAAEQMAHENDEWPLWNPLELTGTPLLANYQSAVFFPLRFPHWFLEPLLAATLFLLIRLWLCGFAAYLCARGLSLDTGPARLFSLAWMMSGVCVNWFYWPLPEVMALIPVVLLGAEYIAIARLRRGFFALAVGAVLILLTGHPETAFMGCLGVGVYFFLRLFQERQLHTSLGRRIATAGGAWGLALLVCAPQVLPFLEYVRNSNISVETYQHTISEYSGLPMQTLVCFLVPRFYGISADDNFWLDGADNSNTTAFLYIGAVTWVCLALLFSRGRYSPRMRSRIIALIVPAAVGLFLALRSQPIEILENLPVWQYWYVTFPLFSLPLLGAFGLQHWLQHERRAADIIAPSVALFVLFCLVAGVFTFYRRVLIMQGLSDYVLRQMCYAACFVGFGVVIVAATSIRVPAKLAAGMLVLLLATDLVFSSRDLLPTTPGEHLFPETRLTSELQAKGHPTRISVLTAGIDSGLLGHYGIEQLHGYDAMYPSRITEFLARTYPDAWNHAERLCSLEYYLFPHGAEDDPSAHDESMELVATVDGIDIMRSPRALPRAFLVGRLERVETPATLFERMHEESFDPTAVALTDTAVEVLNAEVGEGMPGSAAVDEWTTTSVTVGVDVKAKSVLVLTDAYYPGWKAYAEDGELPVFPVYHNFRGVIVEPGISRVEFRFEPVSLRVGLWLSCPTLVIMSLGAGWSLLRSRRRQACALSAP